MESVKLTVIGILTFFLILIELIIGFGTLTLINIPRIIIPFKFFKIFLAKVSNQIGDITVYGLKLIMLLMHGNTIQVINEQKFDSNTWYMAMSNHQSWADICVLLVTANHRIPLLKFFMKKELWWIPFVFLANQTLNMPFVNRHSKEAIKKNPSLRHKDFKNTLKSCKRFLRTPSTIFSYAEGTRFTDEKHALQGKKETTQYDVPFTLMCLADKNMMLDKKSFAFRYKDKWAGTGYPTQNIHIMNKQSAMMIADEIINE